MTTSPHIEQRFLSVRQFARMLGYSPAAVIRAIHYGRIPAIKIAMDIASGSQIGCVPQHHWRIPASVVDTIVQNAKTPQRTDTHQHRSAPG